MAKKMYSKPELKTRRIELGVFGDYSGRGNDSRDNITPVPIEVIRDLNLHME